MNQGMYGYDHPYRSQNQFYPYQLNHQQDSYKTEAVQDFTKKNRQQPQCNCTGNELLCLSIPSPITAVLLGHELQIELPCIKITSEEDLTPVVQQLITSLSQALGGMGGRDPM